MARKRKTLPKEFDAMLVSASLAELIAVFDHCEIDARGGYNKSTALGFRDCPDELIVWLVEQGLDVDARDVRGCTALAERAQSSMQKHVDQIDLLLSLGADIEAPDKSGRTAFVNAVIDLKVSAATLLAERGATVSDDRWNPQSLLEAALARVENSRITDAVGIVRLLIPLGSPISNKMRARVEQISQEFVRARTFFAVDQLDVTQAALDELYTIFDVAPVGRRVMHDGSSDILVDSGTWREGHEALRRTSCSHGTRCADRPGSSVGARG